MIIVQQIVLSLLDKQNSGTYLYKEDSVTEREGLTTFTHCNSDVSQPL